MLTKKNPKKGMDKVKWPEIKEEPLILDIDGVVRDAIEPLKKTALEILKHLKYKTLLNKENIEKWRIYNKAFEEISKLEPKEFIRTYLVLKNKMKRELEKEGMSNPYTRAYCWYILKETKDFDLKEFKKLYCSINGELIDKTYETIVKNSKMFSHAIKAFRIIEKEDINIVVVSASKGVEEWLVKEMKTNKINTSCIKEVFSGFVDKRQVLLEISKKYSNGDPLLFTTDFIHDVECALDANKRGAKIQPIGVLTGLSDAEEFSKKGVPYFRDLYEVITIGRTYWGDL